MNALQCEMSADCTDPVAMIGSKGYIYCKLHGTARRSYGYERTRLMPRWEVSLIEQGLQLPSYQTMSQQAARAYLAHQNSKGMPTQPLERSSD